jgi:N-acetylglucosamine-6-phosphate deacetylase
MAVSGVEIRGAIPTAGLADGVVTVADGVITRVEPAAGGATPDTVILPGLIDIHCHGGGGHSFATTDPAEALAAAAYHASAGTTGIVASLVTAAPEDLVRQLRALAPLVAAGQLLGIHLEGPFLAPARRGAHAPALLRDPDPALVSRLLEAAGSALVIVTIAPERPGAPQAAAMLRAAGVVVAFGHTDADYACMAEALAAADGRGLVTHLGNAMPPVRQRAAGPVAAALVAAAADEASVELIADGVHVDAGFIRLVFATAAPGRVVLVTDSTAAAGMPDGDYTLGPLAVTVSGGVARLASSGGGGEGGGAGTIAGGTSTLLRVVARARAAGVPLADAARAASQAPARVLGLTGSQGSLAPGMAADLVVADVNLALRRVMRAVRWLELPSCQQTKQTKQTGGQNAGHRSARWRRITPGCGRGIPRTRCAGRSRPPAPAPRTSRVCGWSTSAPGRAFSPSC